MKLQIKFSGKSKKTGEWCYGYYAEIHIPITDVDANTKLIISKGTKVVHSLFNDTNRNDSSYWHDIDVETLGRFTGFCDMNNKEIYEGDILKESMSNSKLLVRWNYNNGSFCLSEMVEDAQLHCDSLLGEEISRRFPMEIVGNRWDMSELSNIKG